MTMMQPDPTTEFRKEKEFRAKVYRMLSLGLDTTEIEGLLRQQIDWNLFSQETLREIVEQENREKSKALEAFCANILLNLEQLDSRIDQKLFLTSQEILKRIPANDEKLDKLADLILGSVIALSGIFILGILLLGLLII